MKKQKLFIRVFAIIIPIFILFVLFSSCTQAENTVFESVDELNQPQYKIGLPEGAASMYAGEEYFDNAELLYYNSLSEGYIGVETGKIDAFVFDSHILEFVVEQNKNLSILPNSNFADVDTVIGAPKGRTELMAEVNEFIEYYIAEGIYDDMYERWYNNANPVMPEIEKPENPKGKIKIGTEGMSQPISYIGEDGELIGFDIEFAYRMGLYLGYEIEFKLNNYGGLIASVETGVVDLLISNLNGTEERAESMELSDVYVDAEICVVVHADSVDKSQENSQAVKYEPKYNSVDELVGKKFAVLTGSAYDLVTQELFPTSEIVYTNSSADRVLAVATQKADASLIDVPVAKMAVLNEPKVTYIAEPISEESYAFSYRKNDNDEAYLKLTANLEEFIVENYAPGSEKSKALDEKWFTLDESEKNAKDFSALPATNGVLKYGEPPEVEPFCYVKDGEYVGYHMDMVYEFCKEYGYGFEFVEITMASAIENLNSGKIDIFGGCITVTDERKESINFFSSHYTGGVVALVPSVQVVEAVPEFSTFEQLEGKRLAQSTGTSFFKIIDDNNLLEDYERFEFNTLTDMVAALTSNKIDAITLDDPVARLMVEQQEGIALVPQTALEDKYGIAFTKDSPLTEKVAQVVETFKADGTMDELESIWFSADESKKQLPDLDFTQFEDTPENTIKYSVDNVTVPMSYVGDGGEPLGYDVDLAMRIAYALGMQIEIESVNFSSLIPAIESGKADMVSGCMSITEERMQKVDFVEYYKGGILAVVRAVDSEAIAEEESFFAGIVDSFNSTFIVENRYQLILDGILTTIIITIFAAIFGSILGFGICMMKMSKSKVLSIIASVYIRILQGTPIVVILMILYYIIFGSSDISGVLVAIIGFGINFAAYVSEMMRTGIEAVDKGQIEASHAIGFNKSKTFLKITFPQAAKHFLPVYKGEFISLLKNTSIVGYIAIQDLTKMSDIIRSRTYEAFFPLIATAIIYFILAYVLTLVIDIALKKIDPKNRKRIIKGVDTNSKDTKTNATTVTKNKGETIISVRNLRKEYPIVVPLKDVNTDVKKGEVISIIGPSGTGKSTLLRCINRLETPTSGQITVNGVDITSKECDIFKVRQKMGMVFQSFNLFSHLMVIENIMLGPINLLKISKQQAYYEGMELLRMVGLADKALSYPDELSGGQKQRVAIARTLAMKPDIVLFDEPTSALDPTMIGEVLAVIRSLASQGLTMMIVTHEMKFARDVSSQIFYMDEGIIYEAGEPEEIFDNPKKEKTRAFVKKLKTWNFTINSKDFDFYAMNSEIEEFGRRQLIPQKQINSMHLLVEELVFNLILPHTFNIRLLVESDQESGNLELHLIYGGESFNPIDDDKDELSVMIIRKMSKEVTHSYEKENRLKLVL